MWNIKSNLMKTYKLYYYLFVVRCIYFFQYHYLFYLMNALEFSHTINTMKKEQGTFM